MLYCFVFVNVYGNERKKIKIFKKLNLNLATFYQIECKNKDVNKIIYSFKKNHFYLIKIFFD